MIQKAIMWSDDTFKESTLPCRRVKKTVVSSNQIPAYRPT